jgi:chromosome segregation ATPase
MKSFTAAIFLAGVAPGAATETNPIAKVLDLLAGLQAKIVGEGEEAQKAYDEFAEWCEDASKNLDYEIKTGKGEVADLKALIAEQVATTEELTAKVEELASSIATDEADLQAATEIRAKEATDFGAEETELVEVVDTLGRAIGILEREMQKGGASLLQNVEGVVQALSTMVQAAALSSADGAKLTALVQSSQQSDDDSMGAPAAAVYEGHSGGILDVLGNLQEEAEGQLDAARKKETTALHNFEMLKQSLVDQIKFATSDSDKAKKGIAQAGEKKAGAEGDLDVTSKDLAEDLKSLGGLHQDCMTKAQDFEAATKSRGEELTALASAKKVISETSSGATRQSYGLEQVSFLQIARSKMSTGADLAKFEAVRFIRDLAMKENSPALAQLASRMSSAMRLNSGSSDPFAKVKGLISDMLAKLEADADADATQKAYCDKEMAESNDKKDEMNTEIAKLTTKIDQMSARSSKLKEEVAALQKALATLAKEQQEMDKMRSEEKAIYDHDRPELEQGLDGIKTALKVLREYYAQDDKSHSSADGAAGGIVGLLEVIESDFSKGLAEMIATEEQAAALYDRETKENAVVKATKDKDETYKTKEYVGLDKAIAQATSDRTGVDTELAAVMEYLKKLDDMCIAKPDTYAERKRRREAELAGLKEALTILEGQAFVQKSSSRSLLAIVKSAQDPCAGCTEDHAQAYQTCAMVHGDPCAELNSKGLVGSGPGKKRDVSCCMKKEKHARCMSCKSMDCAHGTCNVNKDYYSKYSTTEANNKKDDRWHNKAMKAAGWGL